jgi:hypothetical protein
MMKTYKGNRNFLICNLRLLNKSNHSLGLSESRFLLSWTDRDDEQKNPVSQKEKPGGFTKEARRIAAGFGRGCGKAAMRLVWRETESVRGEGTARTALVYELAIFRAGTRSCPDTVRSSGKTIRAAFPIFPCPWSHCFFSNYITVSEVSAKRKKFCKFPSRCARVILQM